MLTARINTSTLTVSGEAAASASYKRVDISSANTNTTVVDNDSIGTSVPIDGFQYSIYNIDARGVEGAGVNIYLYDNADGRLRGSAQDDVIFVGGSGSDRLYGYNGDDRISGYDGNDYLHGGNGNDDLNGRDGNDTLIGDRGNDVIDGGEGVDTIIFHGSFAEYEIREVDGLFEASHSGGAGYDGVDRFANIEFLQFADQTVEVANVPTDLIAKISGSTLTVSGEAAASASYKRVDISSANTNTTVVDNDSIGTSVPIDGFQYSIYNIDARGVEGAGVNIYLYDNADGRLRGSAQDDVIFVGGSGSDRLYGYNGDDRISGYDGNDYLHGGNGNDDLNGRDGNDTLIGDRGNDVIDGGEGVDTIIFHGSFAEYEIREVDGLFEISHSGGTGYDGVDKFTNIEFLQFADQSVGFDELLF